VIIVEKDILNCGTAPFQESLDLRDYSASPVSTEERIPFVHKAWIISMTITALAMFLPPVIDYMQDLMVKANLKGSLRPW
jgi:hypothetical protein